MADDETFHRATELVEALAAHHGLSEVRLGQNSGELVATGGRRSRLLQSCPYFNLARFEMELENLLRARVRVVSADARGARPTRATLAGQRRNVGEPDELLGFALETLDEIWRLAPSE